MARLDKRSTFVIQKVIKAFSVSDAIKQEKKAKIVEVTLAKGPDPRLEPLIGFMYNGPLHDEKEI